MEERKITLDLSVWQGEIVKAAVEFYLMHEAFYREVSYKQGCGVSVSDYKVEAQAAEISTQLENQGVANQFFQFIPAQQLYDRMKREYDAMPEVMQ